LLAGSDYYVINAQGLYQDLRNDLTALRAMVEQAPVLTVSGIVRLEDNNSYTRGGLGYTRALTDSVVTRSSESPVVAAQLNQPDRSVLSGLRFAPSDDTQKAEDLKAYIFNLNAEQKADFTRQVYQLFPDMNLGAELEPGEGAQGRQLPEGMSMEDILAMMSIFSGMTGAQTGADSIRDVLPEGSEDLLSQWAQMTGVTMESLSGLDNQQTGALLDSYLSTLSEDALAGLYDQLVAPQIDSLDTTLSTLGLVNLDTPTSISLYTETFESKEEITRLIAEYNETAAAEDQIVYTDYIALMISSVTTIINVISYVLIAFVAVSLVVSSIMIGIITYISVLERTKEIGILRAVGASRKDVARVFTAEAFIIGLAAGILGIVLSSLLTLPINSIIFRLTDDAAIKAILPPEGALILIAISALLSLLAGWIPSRVAAKKDPVEALRTE
jgi:putative ABC transport system permease protein